MCRMQSARRNASNTRSQKILAEVYSKENKLLDTWEREKAAKTATRDLGKAVEEEVRNPYVDAVSISEPTLAEGEMPAPKRSTIKLIRQVEVPFTRIVRVPVKTKKFMTFNVEKKVPVTRTITDMTGTRTVEGFSIVKVPEQKEVVVEEMEEKVINDVKRLEVEELQDFEWEPVAKGPVKIVSSKPTSAGNMFGRPYTPRGFTPTPRTSSPIYVSRHSLSNSSKHYQSQPNLHGRKTPIPQSARPSSRQPQQTSRPQSARPVSREPGTFRPQTSRPSSRASNSSGRPVSQQKTRSLSRSQSSINFKAIGTKTAAEQPKPKAKPRLIVGRAAPAAQTARPASKQKKSRPQTARPSSRSSSRTPSYMQPTKSSQQRVTKASKTRGVEDFSHLYQGGIKNVHLTQYSIGTAEPVGYYRNLKGGMTPPPANRNTIDSHRYW